jgi:hypothetical protein
MFMESTESQERFSPVRGILIVLLIGGACVSWATWDKARSAERAYERTVALQGDLNASLVESSLRLKELKCENKLISAGERFPHQFCHNLYRHDWLKWAHDFPSKAREEAAAKAALADSE